MKEFLVEHQEFIIAVITFIVGLLLPNPKIFSFGKSLGTKIPKKTAEALADKLDALEQGLRGNTELVNGNDVADKLKDIKKDIDLAVGKQVSAEKESTSTGSSK